MLNRLVTCQNVTMEQFGILLQVLGYAESIYTPVADDTGLKGSYSFTLSFTGGGLNAPWGGPRTSASEGPAQASDPGDTLSLASAPSRIRKGWKLEKEKRFLHCRCWSSTTSKSRRQIEGGGGTFRSLSAPRSLRRIRG